MKILSFLLGLGTHRRILALMGSIPLGNLAGSDGVWARYLDASEAIVGHWGGPWWNVELFGRKRGVWALVFLLGVVLSVGGFVVIRSFESAVLLGRDHHRSRGGNSAGLITDRVCNGESVAGVDQVQLSGRGVGLRCWAGRTGLDTARSGGGVCSTSGYSEAAESCSEAAVDNR